MIWTGFNYFQTKEDARCQKLLCSTILIPFLIGKWARLQSDFKLCQGDVMKIFRLEVGRALPFIPMLIYHHFSSYSLIILNIIIISITE